MKSNINYDSLYRLIMDIDPIFILNEMLYFMTKYFYKTLGHESNLFLVFDFMLMFSTITFPIPKGP